MAIASPQPTEHPVAPAEPPTAEVGKAVEQYLAEQQAMTAVERFAKQHELHEGTEPAQAKYYQDLLPLSKPQAGEQYAFEVDLTACSGCKACVSACHHMNGLEPTETWRWVGQLYGEGPAQNGHVGLPVVQHVTSACHHCVEPGCLSGCPTNAYEKDPETGIVRHLDDQCFGCQYCTMACPYEVPQYSSEKGIVRKCDMCHDRLAEGEAPACVQACPNQAIRITTVSTEVARQRATAGTFLPDSPTPKLTKPTTVYTNQEALSANVAGADVDFAAPQHAHWPLVIMLTLTQMSAGGVLVTSLVRWLSGEGSQVFEVAAFGLSTLAGLLGLAVAPLHLGRPHLAFRSVLGWRHSWLSREAIVFGLFAPLLIGSLVLAALPLIDSMAEPFLGITVSPLVPALLRVPVELGAILAGALGVYCSARIYQFTGRDFWVGPRTWLKFLLTSLVLGFATTLACGCVANAFAGGSYPVTLLALGLIVTTLAKRAYEQTVLSGDSPHNLLRLTAKLLKNDLATIAARRQQLALLGGVAAPLLALGITWLGHPLFAAIVAPLALALSIGGEIAARYLYFSAVVPLRMPGGIQP